MGSMGALIAITCIANYISGMILAREKYDTLKMIVYIVVLISFFVINIARLDSITSAIIIIICTNNAITKL